MATIGKNILENLTTGMYSDSKVSYREYIQNACDQIDLAVKEGILASDDGEIEVYIDEAKRYISIRDNATGSKAKDFVADLGDIANSNKKIGENKGFRGIGRLCGLAYCRVLKFTTSYAGESVASVMICDAEKMRKMLASPVKYTIDQIWDEIVKFETKPEKAEKHYFEVELIDVGKAHSELLNKEKVVEYLSFVAPVPYNNKFYLNYQVYDYAERIGYKIDEYRISVNGERLFKNYTTKLKEESGSNIKNYDEITKLEFHSFKDGDGKLVAWMWVGLSRFEKQIPKINVMRGIRLRSSNIQLGDDDTLQKRNLFKETRGNYYFVGEVFAVDEGLIPNSQRDYFNENECRVQFENLLSDYFRSVLHKLYYNANGIKNAIKAQHEYVAKVEEYNEKVDKGGFVDETSREKMLIEIEEAKAKADKAEKILNKYDDVEEDSPLAEVRRSIKTQYEAESVQGKTVSVVTKEPPKGKNTYITTGLSKLTKAERKLVSKIMTIVSDVAPKEIAEQIIERITKELK